MSSEQLVRNCAPTLAGIKTGSLYTWHFNKGDDYRHDISVFNRFMNKKGLRIVPLKVCESYALIYLYRPEMLRKDLQDPTAAKMLSDLGYSLKSPDRSVADLVRRFKDASSFPHEIGLFLGYPPSDVQGFIRSPNGYRYVGLWKVYSDENNAKAAFRRYRRCTEEYGRMLRSGRTLEQLVV